MGSPVFQERFKQRDEQARYLQDEIEKALRRYFDRTEPQRYELTRLLVAPRPRRREHPRGWNAFDVKITLTDLTLPGVQGIPSLKIDIAAPEELLPESLKSLSIGGKEVKAYRLERIAGEKMRPFLSTLPSYRKKLSETPRAVRAKDLYDIARIEMEYSIGENSDFWKEVGQEFFVACKSRFVDCQGLSTFAEDLDITRQTYEKDTSIPKDI